MRMELKVNISELKKEGNEVVDELADFLKEKTGTDVEITTDNIVLKSEEKLSKPQLRLLLRKYLHQTELKDYYRVIGKKESCLFIKEKKGTAEEEE